MKVSMKRVKADLMYFVFLNIHIIRFIYFTQRLTFIILAISSTSYWTKNDSFCTRFIHMTNKFVSSDHMTVFKIISVLTFLKMYICIYIINSSFNYVLIFSYSNFIHNIKGERKIIYISFEVCKTVDVVITWFNLRIAVYIVLNNHTLMSNLTWWLPNAERIDYYLTQTQKWIVFNFRISFHYFFNFFMWIVF